MEKLIYGYKEKDVLGLAEFILNRKGGKLRDAFGRYAEQSGKAQGTVRNLYYALAKKSNSDVEFCQKYLGGKPLAVGKIVEFDKAEEQALVKAILKEKLLGKSVRKAIRELANGDEKKALRYQNKFRNFLKTKPELIEKFSKELSLNSDEALEKDKKELISKAEFKKLKAEINCLIEKISFSVRKENEKLKAKNAFLERENARLKQELLKNASSENLLGYFSQRGGATFLN